MLRNSPLLADVSGLCHGFTPRVLGGAPLDLGAGAPQDAWARALDALGLPDAPVALVSQVHGAAVLPATSGGLQGRADALITETPGLVLAVRVADCVPVIVADLDPRGRPVRVAAVHAGWRGVAAGVIPAALAALDARGPSGGRRLAAVGPCISQSAYEVGPEVVEGVAAAGVPRGLFARRGDPDRGERDVRFHVDLRAAASHQLFAAGADRVDVLPGCSRLDPDLHSYRRDGAASGRMAALVALRPAPGRAG